MFLCNFSSTFEAVIEITLSYSFVKNKKEDSQYVVMIYVNSINWFLQLRRAHSEVSAPFLILCTVFNLLCFVFLHLSLYGVSRKRR